VLLIANRLILNRLWQPFYAILKEVRFFNLADSTEISHTETRIEEFAELNQAATAMASRARFDYKHLKSFTENASHELLTPIAVIHSKLDTLIQTDNFDERQSKLLGDLYGAVTRLSRLNQSLILLAKIENNLLIEKETIGLHQLIAEATAHLSDIFLDKRISVTRNLNDKEIMGNRYLVEILLNNLIINAIRHNREGGSIIIDLKQDSLTIKNTGDQTPLITENVFTRFHKSDTSEGSGLGLTICKQICENMGWELKYQHVNPHHTFIIVF
jgi:signal transduction histidine kinase